ncbi:MAG: M20/M25/M40 family metallo-hydrolase [Rhodobacteraceae bacterium]|nr:M20/M25/M40 family metallo-hydrolase [Paracoccaceae bacterium]
MPARPDRQSPGPPPFDGATDWTPFAATRARAIEMVSWPSETGTEGEAGFAPRLHAMLLRLPYFRAHPGDLVLLDSHGQPPRQNLVAIVRGQGGAAVALAGHYDTVATDNYGPLQPLACTPAALRDALIDDLTASGRDPLALEDLRSDAFLPGRGMLDMKSGLAAGLAALERFAARPDRQGNLILLASPDEEAESRGIRALRDHLPGLLAERGLHLRAAINMDATSDQGDGRAGRTVYEGSIGKLAPCALVIGRPAHAAYPFEGVSAARMAAEVLRAVDAAPALADTGPGAAPAPPPVALEARDLQPGYEVTTPARMWLAFNWLFHSDGAAARLEQFAAVVQAAAAQGLEDQARAAAALAPEGAAVQSASPPPVLQLAALRARVLADPALARAHDAQAAALESCANPLEAARRMMTWLAEAAGVAGPAVVLGLGSLHYPPVRLDPARAADARMLAALDRLQADCAADPWAAFRRAPHFMGISDMSFLGQPTDPGAGAVAANSATARMTDHPAPEALAFPVINLGPWGRDFHQRLERVHAAHAFDRLPRMLLRLADLLLQDAPAP